MHAKIYRIPLPRQASPQPAPPGSLLPSPSLHLGRDFCLTESTDSGVLGGRSGVGCYGWSMSTRRLRR